MAELLRVKDVAEKLNIGVSTVWYYTKQGKLPAPVKLSPRVSVWKAEDIAAFIESVGGAA